MKQKQTIELNARVIYSTEKRTKHDIFVSVAASPFYMPEKAEPSFSMTGDLIINFHYDAEVKTGIKRALLKNEVAVDYETKTGRAVRLTIPKHLVQSENKADLKLKIEGVFEVLHRSNAEYQKYKDALNFGSYDAVARSLKAYAGEYSQALR